MTQQAVKSLTLGIALFGALSLGACSSSSKDKSETPSESAAATEAAPAGPTDAEIAHIVVTANTIDTEAGELAKKTSKNKKVRDLANRMIKDHTSVNKQATELAARLNVTPQDNAVSQSLMSEHKQHLEHLKGLKGKEFDKAYIDHEVKYHQDVLSALDTTLIPNADNEELKALMVKVRPAFVAHLDHAKKMQSSLK